MYSVALSPDGTSLASAGYGRSLKLWDLSSSGASYSRLLSVAGACQGACYSQDGRSLLVVDGQAVYKVPLSDSGSGSRRQQVVCRSRLVEEQDLDLDALYTVISDVPLLTPDGEHVLFSAAAVGKSGKRHVVEVHDVLTGRFCAMLEGHEGAVRALCVTPDCCTVVTGGNDRTVRSWDLASGVAVWVMQGHTSVVTCVVALPESQTAISGSCDHTLRVWWVRVWGCATTR